LSLDNFSFQTGIKIPGFLAWVENAGRKTREGGQKYLKIDYYKLNLSFANPTFFVMLPITYY
jgi:hypothetical protein